MAGFSRRDALVSLAALPAASLLPSRSARAAETRRDEPATIQQDPALVKQMVGWSHGNIEGVRQLLAKQPDLAKAQYDWGFGDWESAIGAASHVGNADIARLLLDHGARPTLFTHAMLGHLDVVRAAIEAVPGIQRELGPHGFTLLHHARAGREPARAVLEYLQSIEGADTTHPTQPVTPEQVAAIFGVYEGAGLGRLTVKDLRGSPAIEPEGGEPRRLFHHGNLVFNPAGAGGVRVEFEVEGGSAKRLHVRYPDPAFVAERVA